MRERLIRPLLGAACIAAILVVFLIPARIPGLAAFVILFAILFHGYLLGTALTSRSHWSSAALLGMALFLALQSVIQTAWYYVGDRLGTASDAGSIIGAILVAQYVASSCLVRDDVPESVPTESPRRITARILGPALILLALAATALVLNGAALAATSDSIRTPWPLLPSWTLAAIAATWLALVVSVLAIRSRAFGAAHAALAVAATTAIAPLVYRIGFGFDGFLHVASERILLATGTLSPKPFYYIGQYAFTTWLSRLTDLSVADLDRWLVPVAAAVLLPLCLLHALGPERKRSAGFLALALLPLAGFVATTPQGFAYVLGTAALLLSAGFEERTVHPLAPLLLGAWAVASHPLAGVPILFVVAACIAARSPRIVWKIAAAASILCAGAAVPFLFWFLSRVNGLPIAWDPGILFRAETWTGSLAGFVPWIGNRFALWPGWASLVAQALPVILLAAAIGGYIATRRRTTLMLASSAVALWLSGIALKTAGEFAFLIDYERGNYADRLNVLAIFCLVAATIPAMTWFWDRARRAPRFVLVACAGFLVAIAAGLAYDALPRHDAIVIGRGWSVSRFDIEAVKLIDRDAGARPYAVLANQSVSAAAVSILGFKRYAGDVFFYPIPTGGPLYETFLRMTYGEPSRNTVKDAGAIAKTDLVYVVLNDYWWRSQAVSEAIRDIADADWDAGNGKDLIYRFDLSADSRSATTTSTR